LDAAAVILFSSALAWAAGIDPLATTAIVSMAYFTLGTALFGESPAKYAVEEPQLREWMTDARRVAPSPRLRVRIKVSH
jgi:hypothetical protein